MAYPHRLRVRNWPDFLSGLLFIGLGLLALLEAVRYDIGTMQRMGAGYFPIILSAVLVFLGLATAATSLGWRSGADEPATAEEEVDAESGTFSWQAVRAVFFVIAALVLFALALPRFGLVAAVVLLVFVSSFADSTLSWLATAVIATVMAFIAVAVFRWGIGLPFPVWP